MSEPCLGHVRIYVGYHLWLHVSRETTDTSVKEWGTSAIWQKRRNFLDKTTLVVWVWTPPSATERTPKTIKGDSQLLSLGSPGMSRTWISRELGSLVDNVPLRNGQRIANSIVQNPLTWFIAHLPRLEIDYLQQAASCVAGTQSERF